MTHSLTKQLPTIQPKYGDPIVVDPRTFTVDRIIKKKLSSNFRESPGFKPNFEDREESYKNDVHGTKPVLFNNNETEQKKLQDVQKLLRRKYATRTKMFSIFNGWDGQPKGYINHQNLRSVLGLMGINLTEQQSKDFIKLHSPNEDKLNLNSFLNIIYSPSNDVVNEGKFENIQPSVGDDRFKNNFMQEQYDCRNLKLENVNKLDSYYLQKALIHGQKIKNKLQKYFQSEEQAKQ